MLAAGTASPTSAAFPSRRAPRTRVVVIYGGRSAEHEVSCISARHVVDALDRARYDVSVLGVALDGRWVDATDCLSGQPAAANSPAAGAGLPSPTGLDTPPIDPWSTLAGYGPEAVVFPIIHGPTGEDGTIQGLLEMVGLPYVGSGVLGSAAAMDKGMAKALLGAAGLAQARHVVLRVDDIGDGMGEQIGGALGWPVFVKPANLGSTIGISRAPNAAALDAALGLALRYDEYVVIEEQITGREIELAVLGHVDLAVSQPGETLPSHDFYDFDDKYVAGAAGLAVPADLPRPVAEEAKSLALRACRALHVEGMARVDFFYEAPGRGLLINEVNTVPGFTAISMYPRLWAAEGLPPPKLIDELLAAAQARHHRRRAFATMR